MQYLQVIKCEMHLIIKLIFLYTRLQTIIDAIDHDNKDVIRCHFEADETKKAEMKKAS